MKVFEFYEEKLLLLDQTLLPEKLNYIEIRNVDSLIKAIMEMKIRGAPLLGIIAAYGVVLEAKVSVNLGKGIKERVRKAIKKLRNTRPTAYNLFNSLSRMEKIVESSSQDEMYKNLLKEAKNIEKKEKETCSKIAENGARILPKDAKVLTLCNTGTLATGGVGTALGVIRKGWKTKRIKKIYVCETRPLLQGSRLTMWELKNDDIPATLITDGSAAFLMKKGEVNIVIVGADRVVKNGDTANKIGTFSLALSAKAFEIPFYVAAPLSTFDLKISSGEEIIIEERASSEILSIKNNLIAPPGSTALNFAFDVTPGEYIKGFITEKGILTPPFDEINL